VSDDVNGLGDGDGRGRVVTRYHHYADASEMALANRVGHARLRRIDNADKT